MTASHTAETVTTEADPVPCEVHSLSLPTPSPLPLCLSPVEVVHPSTYPQLSPRSPVRGKHSSRIESVSYQHSPKQDTHSSHIGSATLTETDTCEQSVILASELVPIDPSDNVAHSAEPVTKRVSTQ